MEGHRLSYFMPHTFNEINLMNLKDEISHQQRPEVFI